MRHYRSCGSTAAASAGQSQRQAPRASPQRLRKSLQVSPGMRGSNLLRRRFVMAEIVGLAPSVVLLRDFHGVTIFASRPVDKGTDFGNEVSNQTAMLGTELLPANICLGDLHGI